MFLPSFVSWVFFGILAYGLFFWNMYVSPAAQKTMSIEIGKGYSGGSLLEDILLFCLLIGVLIGALILGPLGLIWQYKRSVTVRKHRKRVEDAIQKMFNHGWCI